MGEGRSDRDGESGGDTDDRLWRRHGVRETGDVGVEAPTADVWVRVLPTQVGSGGGVRGV